jgi:hypothetical protein
MTFGEWLDLMWKTNAALMTPALGVIEGGITLLAMLLILGLNHFTIRRGIAQATYTIIMVLAWYGLKAYVIGATVNQGDALLSTVFTFQLSVAVAAANLLAAAVIWLAPGPTVKVRRAFATILRGAAEYMEADAQKTTAEKRAEVLAMAEDVLAKKNATEGA